MFIRKKIVTEEDRAKALAKAREKQRKRITKYGQAKPRHARKGIYSCCYASLTGRRERSGCCLGLWD